MCHDESSGGLREISQIHLMGHLQFTKSDVSALSLGGRLGGQGAVLDWDLFMLMMKWWRSVRSDFNQERAVMLREDARRVRRME